MTTDGLPGFPADDIDRTWLGIEEDRRRTVPDILGRDLPTVSNPDPCGGGDLPTVREQTEPGHSDELAADSVTESVVVHGINCECHDVEAKVDPKLRATLAASSSLAEQARGLVDGERQDAYGEPVGYMQRVADACSAVLSRPFTPEEVCLIYTTAKLVREGYRPDHDNRVDAIGYLEILERIRTHSAAFPERT